MDWINLLLGLGTGVVLAVFGYLKTLKEDEAGNPTLEDFDPVKFLETVIVGLAVGVYAYYAGVSHSVAEQVLINAGTIVIFEYVAKFLWRYLSVLGERALDEMVSS